MSYELEEKFYRLDTPDFRKAAQLLLEELRAYDGVSRLAYHCYVIVDTPECSAHLSLIFWDIGLMNHAYHLECAGEIPDTEYCMSATVAHGEGKAEVEEYLLKCIDNPEILKERVEGLARSAKKWGDDHDGEYYGGDWDW